MQAYSPQFILSKAPAITGLRRHLRECGYELGPARTTTGTREIYDTFDWRLFNNGLLLGYDTDVDVTLLLYNLADAWFISQDKTKAVARFHHELESAAIAARLAPVIEERALISQGGFALYMEKRNISDKHGKIIAKLHVERLTKQAGNDKKTGRPLRIVGIRALKGYERKSKKYFPG